MLKSMFDFLQDCFVYEMVHLTYRGSIPVMTKIIEFPGCIKIYLLIPLFES